MKRLMSFLMTLEAVLFIIFIALVLVFGTLPARSSPMETWSGAGPNACHGRCDLEWAMTLLTDDEHAELAAVMVEQLQPADMLVPDGAVFSLATYYRDGEARGYRTHTVAVLDEPEPAVGWQMDGWSFVKLDDCSNWTIVTDQVVPTAGLPAVTTTPVELYRATPQRPRISTPVTTIPVQPPTITWEPPVLVVYDPPVIIPPVIDTPTPSPVPLPATVWMLLASMGALVAFKRRA